MPVLYACTVFLSAFLLFLVQPIIAKQILPWFGGSASVWTTCLVFFQALLLAGYAYSHWSARSLRPRPQAMLHITLLFASCLVLPIIASPDWKPQGNEDPGLRIVLLLGATVGLPYLLLSTTGPLVQVWFARNLSRVPYRLFALSNLGSLIGLLAYPFAIEPWVSTRLQSFFWSASYVAFAVLCAASAWLSRHAEPVAGAYAEPKKGAKPDHGGQAEAGTPTLANRLMWVALSATGSMLLLAVSNHICQNIASIPFLWIVPLSLYLLTFVLVFDTSGWYVRTPFLILAAVAIVGMGSTLTSLDLKVAIPVHLAGLFVLCMVCHGELSMARPSPRHLTGYFLSISAGGVLGGLVIGFGAPHFLQGYFELGLVLALTAVLMFIRLRHVNLLRAVLAATALYSIFVSHQQIRTYDDSMVASSRNFYGTLRVRDLGGPDEIRTLNHGAIRHGGQIRQPVEKRRLPTTYYGHDSGIGTAILALQARRPTVRVGVIGLGTGTIAAYGRAGDVVRFYDINTQVIDFARRYFTFLADSKAKVELALGDARLSLEREPPQQLDILAIDAFSGDSVPAHLLTAEALDVYLRHLKPDGVLLFHTTNRYLELAPVVRMLAESRGMAAALIEHEPTEAQEEHELLSNSDWVIVTRDLSVMKLPEIAVRVKNIALPPRATPWTDDYNNLFHVLK